MIMEPSDGAPDPDVTPTAATNGGDARRRTRRTPQPAVRRTRRTPQSPHAATRRTPQLAVRRNSPYAALAVRRTRRTPQLAARRNSPHAATRRTPQLAVRRTRRTPPLWVAKIADSGEKVECARLSHRFWRSCWGRSSASHGCSGCQRSSTAASHSRRVASSSGSTPSKSAWSLGRRCLALNSSTISGTR